MSTFLSILVVIVGVLAFGFLRDSRRTGAVTQWAQSRGFAVVPKPEHDHARLVAWAQRFRPQGAPAHWGNVLRGESGGVETTIAEHEEQRRSSPARWHTLAVARVPGLKIDPVRITKAGSALARHVTDAVVAPGKAVREHLGIEVTERPPVHPVGQGKWAVEVANDAALAFWSSDAQAAAIDAWPHDDAELAVADDYVLVRVPGLINAERLDDVLAYAGAARTLFTQAAAKLA